MTRRAVRDAHTLQLVRSGRLTAASTSDAVGKSVHRLVLAGMVSGTVEYWLHHSLIGTPAVRVSRAYADLHFLDALGHDSPRRALPVLQQEASDPYGYAGKRRYEQAEAQRAAEAQHQRVYACPWCESWHDVLRVSQVDPLLKGVDTLLEDFAIRWLEELRTRDTRAKRLPDIYVTRIKDFCVDAAATARVHSSLLLGGTRVACAIVGMSDSDADLADVRAMLGPG